MSLGICVSFGGVPKVDWDSVLGGKGVQEKLLEEVTPWKTKMVAQNDPLEAEKSDIES